MDSLPVQSSTKAASPGRSLEGKLAIVTGGSRGIGAAIATHLAARGASIVVNYTSEKSAETTVNLAKTLEEQHNVSTLVVQADMGSPAGPADLISKAKEHFSKGAAFQIDIIVNNAGIARNSTIDKVNIEDFDDTYRINVLGPLLLMQAALPYLPNDRSGRIVNLSSVSAAMGFVGQSIYGGTKAALEAMTRSWSRELSERATVNAINPGPVASDMWFGVSDAFLKGLRPFIETTPLQKVRPGIDGQKHIENAELAGGRPAYPEEIAGVVGMLCSSDASWVTGQVVCANGGMLFGR